MGGVERLRVRYRQFATPWYDVLFASRDELTGLVEGTGWITRRFVDEGALRAGDAGSNQVAEANQPRVVRTRYCASARICCSVS